MIESAYFEDDDDVMDNGQQSQAKPKVVPMVVSDSAHEHNISYVDPIDDALHTSYQWSKPGFSIDHVYVCISLYIFTTVFVVFILLACIF